MCRHPDGLRYRCPMPGPARVFTLSKRPADLIHADPQSLNPKGYPLRAWLAGTGGRRSRKHRWGPRLPTSRRDFLKGVSVLTAGAMGAAVGGLASKAAGDERLRAERLEIRLPELDLAHDGLRIAHLTDFHVGPFTPAARIRAAIAAANAFAPDLTVLTGDYVTAGFSGPGSLGSALGGLTSPTVAVLGNHDHAVGAPRVTAALERLGYRVLRNESIAIKVRGASLYVVGIDDLVTRHADPSRALRDVPARASRVCLAHVPSTVNRIATSPARPSLLLSGHTHGGQVNLHGLWTARQPYLAGLFHVGACQLYVSRGIGNIWVPLRVNAPPDVSLITVRAGGC